MMGNKNAVGSVKNPLKYSDPEAYRRLKYAWTNMKTRCLNENIADYKNYGGRGIAVDLKWFSFKGFIEDMYESFPKENRRLFTLDRINVNENYTKNNCRWATRKEQSRNSRRNVLVSFLGKAKTITEWAEIMGLKSSTVRQRYYVYGWNVKDSLTTPVA
jgi:plasmid replication initiation protein